MRRWIVYFGIILLVALFILPSMSFAQGGSGIGTVYTTYKQRTTAAPTPASGYDRLYFKSDDKLYRVTSAGSEAEVGSGDVTGVGDCASGACLDGSSDGGTYIRLYDGDSHYTALYAGNSSANLSFYFPTAAGAQGGVLYFSAANQLAILAAATAGNPLISGGAAANPSFLSIVLAGGTNTFSITNGTASLDVAAGITADINAAFTVNTALTIQTGAVTITGNAAGSTLVLPAGSLTLPVPTAAGQIPIASGANVFAISTYKYPTSVCTSGYILTSDGTDIVCSNTLSIGELNVPSADADPTAATAGQLSHDTTDTAASGGGNLKFADGTNVRTVVSTGTTFTHVTRFEYLPIRYAEDDDTVAAPAAVAEIGTTGVFARSFVEDADNGVVFNWQVPSDFVSGIKYRVYYATDTNAGANETAVFGLSGCSSGNLDALCVAEGDQVDVTDELDDTYDTGELIVSPWSGAVTVTNIAAGEIAHLLLIRDVSADDMVGHALVIGIEIKYVGKLNPFSDY